MIHSRLEQRIQQLEEQVGIKTRLKESRLEIGGQRGDALWDEIIYPLYKTWGIEDPGIDDADDDLDEILNKCQVGGDDDASFIINVEKFEKLFTAYAIKIGLIPGSSVINTPTIRKPIKPKKLRMSDVYSIIESCPSYEKLKSLGFHKPLDKRGGMRDSRDLDKEIYKDSEKFLTFTILTVGYLPKNYWFRWDLNLQTTRGYGLKRLKFGGQITILTDSSDLVAQTEDALSSLIKEYYKINREFENGNPSIEELDELYLRFS